MKSQTATTSLPSWGNDTPPPPPPLPTFLFASQNKQSSVNVNPAPQNNNNGSPIGFSVPTAIGGMNNSNSNSNNNCTNEIDMNKHGKINNMGIFTANSSTSSPRKRNRLKMEEVFRTMSIKSEEQEISPPSRKRQELWCHRSPSSDADSGSSPNTNVFQTHSFNHPNENANLNGTLPITSPISFPTYSSEIKPLNEACMEEDVDDDDSSEATPPTNNTSSEKNAVKQVMYSLVFGNQRHVPSRRKSFTPPSSVLAPLNHVDAKIEQMIRKSRLQALIMTGRPNSSQYDTSSPNNICVRDDFIVNVSSDYGNHIAGVNQFGSNGLSNESGSNMLNNGSTSTNSFPRQRSKSFDDLEMSM